MSCDWIQIRSGLPSDPRVSAIAARLNITTATAVGALVMFWAMADQHTTDGVLPLVSPASIDHLVGVKGFAEALLDVDWLAVNEGGKGVAIPRFHKFNGRTSKDRALGARRAKRQREKGAPVPAPDAPEGGHDHDASVTRPLRPSRAERDEHHARSVTAIPGRVTVGALHERTNGAPKNQNQNKIPPSEAAPPRSPRAAAAEAAAGSGSRVPGSGEAGGNQAAAAAASSQAGSEAEEPLTDAERWPVLRPDRENEAAPLLSAAKWARAPSSRDLAHVIEACRRVETAWKRGEIELGPRETYAGFLIRRANAYGLSDQCRGWPTSLTQWLRQDYWLDSDESWKTQRRPGGGRAFRGEEPGGMTPEQVERLRAKNLEEAERRRAEDEAIRAQRPSAEEVSAILGRVRNGGRNGSHPAPGTPNPEPVAVGAGGGA